MKGFFEMNWKNDHPQPRDRFKFDKLEETMGIKLPDDLKELMYRNNNSEYPDMDNYILYDENGEEALWLYGKLISYVGIDQIIRMQEIAREDVGEIYYWHLPLNICGQSRIALDYTHCRHNPSVVWVSEEIGPYEDELGDPQWKMYIAATFKEFIEMIGDRNKPVGDWIDQDLMADGSRQERK